MNESVKQDTVGERTGKTNSRDKLVGGGDPGLGRGAMGAEGWTEVLRIVLSFHHFFFFNTRKLYSFGLTVGQLKLQ